MNSLLWLHRYQVIPKNITREHVVKAIREIDTKGVPSNRNSKRFLLIYDGKEYPSKNVISLANKYANDTSRRLISWISSYCVYKDICAFFEFKVLNCDIERK